MKHRILALAVALTAFVVSLIGAAVFYGAPAAHADYFSYPCSPGGQGTGVDVNAVVVDVSGQFCDGPTQFNLSHLHCLSGGAGVNIGAIGGISLGGSGITLGGFGGRGAGGSGGNCTYVCPDGTQSPPPNPPFYGSSAPYVDARKVILANRAFCVKQHHLVSNGPTSDIVRPEEGDPDLYKPGPSLDDLIAQNQAQAAPPPPPPADAPAPPPPEGEAPDSQPAAPHADPPHDPM